jgi:WD40 repeat protein
MATQHRRWYRKQLGKMLWLLLLLALVGGFWQWMSPSPRTAWQMDKKASLVGFAHNGKILVTRNQEDFGGPIRLWDVDTGKLRFALAHELSRIYQIEFSPDGRFLAARNEHERLLVWDIATGEERLNRKLEIGYSGFRFCPDSKHILFESRETEPFRRLVHFWNIETKCVDAIVPGSVRETAVAQDGKRFAQWHWNEDGWSYARVQFWRLGERPGEVTLDRQFNMTFCDIAFPTNLETFVTVSQQFLGRRGAEIAVWDSVTGRKKSATAWQDPKMWVQFMFFSPDDKLVIADIRGAGWKLIRWDVRHEIKLVSTLAKREPKLQSPDGKMLLIAQPDGAELLDAKTLAKRGTLHKEGDHLPMRFGSDFGLPYLPHFSFSADSKMVIATGLEAKPEEQPISDWFANWFGFARPGRSFWWTGDPIARLYDTDTATEVIAFQKCSQAQFSPDGLLIATAHDDGAVRIWHVPPRKSLELVLGLPVSIWLAELVGTYVMARRLQRRRALPGTENCSAVSRQQTFPPSCHSRLASQLSTFATVASDVC